MGATDLTTVEAVTLQGVASGSGANRVLQGLIAQASQFFRDQTGWPYGLGSVTYTAEKYNGTGGTELYLTNPVSSVSSLIVDAGPAIPAQSANGQPGYFLDGQVLCLQSYIFTRGRRNVRVTYSGDAGTNAVIEQAIVEMVAAAYKRVPRGPEMESETTPATGAVIRFAMKDVPPYARSIIQRYSRVAPA